MKIVLQRVKSAKVEVSKQTIGAIKKGFLLLVGIKENDTQKEIDYLVHKIINLRIFEDENGKMNLSLKDVKGSILSVSQFTLYANTKKGNRPSFTGAGSYQYAQKIFNLFNHTLKKSKINISTGKFGSNMQVELINDGPVTIIFDTDYL